MSGSERQAAAHARLSARRGRRASDADLATETLNDLRAVVEQRGGLDEDEAERLASEEMQRMRAERRAHAWLGAWARADTGTSPAHDTRFGSSKSAEATGRVCDSCVYEMPFDVAEFGSREISLSDRDRAFHRHDPLRRVTESVHPGLSDAWIMLRGHLDLMHHDCRT